MINVAIIPARGGSKRIARKNIRSFAGLPMVAWSIQAALQCGCFDRVVVSTDDEEIAEVARTHGAETPFVRPAELSGDHVGTMPVVAHAVETLDAQGTAIAHACCIYATAPFLQPEDLRRGLRILLETNARFAFAVTSYAFPIQRAVRILANERVEMFDAAAFETRSQDLEPAWHDAGQFYWGQAEAWREGGRIFGTGSAPVRIPRLRVQDIDSAEDWERAEWMHKAMRLSEA